MAKSIEQFWADLGLSTTGRPHKMTEREIYEMARRIFVQGAKDAETPEVQAMAAGFVATLDQRLAALNDGRDDARKP